MKYYYRQPLYCGTAISEDSTDVVVCINTVYSYFGRSLIFVDLARINPQSSSTVEG